MKELTKMIRKDVKEMVLAVGGTDNVTGGMINSLLYKYCPEAEYRFDSKACEIYTAIQNQFDYFKFAKNM